MIDQLPRANTLSLSHFSQMDTASRASPLPDSPRFGRGSTCRVRLARMAIVSAHSQSRLLAPCRAACLPRFTGSILPSGPDLRQARVAEAQGRRRLARARRAQSLRSGMDARRRRRSCPAPSRRSSARIARAGCFAMAYLPPDTPSRLEGPAADRHRRIARLRRQSATRSAAFTPPRRIGADIAARFETDELFHALRLEPYLEATARAHPDLAPRLDALVETTRTTKRVLVHGDFSPKNLLIGPAGPVILDAECAWYGDPAFDLAFVLNHLLLKGAWQPQWRARYVDAFDGAGGRVPRARRLGGAGELRSARGGAVARAHARAHRRQVAGRVSDRRSQKDAVRAFARSLLADPVATVGAIAQRWLARIAERSPMTPIDRSRAFTAGASGIRAADRRVEAEVVLDSGAIGRAIAPAGASRGSREAIDLRDGGSRFGGMDVTRAIANVDGPIARALVGRDALRSGRHRRGTGRARRHAEQGEPRRQCDGRGVARGRACGGGCARDVPLWRYLAGDDPVTLPLPEIQIFGGGAHAGRRIDIQDLMVMPVGATSFAQALEMTAEVYRAAGELMRDAGKLAGVADEGGWWPAVRHATKRRSRCSCARSSAPASRPASDVAISLDIAASEFGRDGRYRLGARAPRTRPRRHDRDAARLDRSLSDRVDRGSARRGRPRRLDRFHARRRRSRPDHRRRLPHDECRARRAGREPTARATPCSSSPTRRAR